MSLFKRVIGVESPKIPIHEIESLVSEISLGEITINEVFADLQLTDDEKSDFNVLLLALSSAKHKRAMAGRVLKLLYLGERGKALPSRDYTDEAQFWIALEKYRNRNG